MDNGLINKMKTVYLNFGPQHPAAHGVIRLVTALQGEQIVRVDPHIGLLHRGTEKLIEFKTIMQSIPYFDRLDYVSMLANEHTFTLAVERLNNTIVTRNIQINRVIMLELTRLLNHLLALTTHAMDVGALTPFIWAFEEREKILEFYERISGARMHANLFNVGGIKQFENNFFKDFSTDLYGFLKQFNSRLDELEELITTNRIWIERLCGVGVISVVDAINYSFSGPLIRSTGLLWDLRKTVPYEIYSILDFSIPIGAHGDCYDRYLIRLYELRQSIFILFQLIEDYELSSNTTVIGTTGHLTPINSISTSMEALIHHFRQFTANNNGNFLQQTSFTEDSIETAFPIDDTTNIITYNMGVDTNNMLDIEVYMSTESPKGEIGVYLIQSEDSDKLYRCKIRAPGFFHIQGLNLITQGHLIADIVTIIGTQDLVFGEIDR